MANDDKAQFRESLSQLLRELFEGPPADAAYFLNRGDRGLLASLERLSAADASAQPNQRASVAAHVDHLRYGLSLLNRWARGENPWSDADWAPSWERIRVTDDQWRRLRDALAAEAHAWRTAVRDRRDWDRASMIEIMASVVHLAYHLGAVRQIQPAAGGPLAKDVK